MLAGMEGKEKVSPGDGGNAVIVAKSSCDLSQGSSSCLTPWEVQLCKQKVEGLRCA